MLSSLKIEFTTDDSGFSYRKSSNMHGLLMQLIPAEYCEKLHSMQTVPCSQHLELGEKNYWLVNGLNEEAYHQVIEPLMNSRGPEYQLKGGIGIRFVSRELRIKPKKDLVEKFYDTSEPDRSLSLELLTPVSFRSASRYVNLPDLRLMFQSWMNRFSATSDMEMFDEDALKQLEEHSVITRYSLRSRSFPLEQITVPAFAGTMTVRVGGTATMARYARLLAEFGEYSGVGIKTFLGMGAMRLVQENDHRLPGGLKTSRRNP